MTQHDWKVSKGMEIREQREALGVTQDELGSAVGVTGQTISNWEMGKTMLGALSERKIAAFFRSAARPGAARTAIDGGGEVL